MTSPAISTIIATFSRRRAIAVAVVAGVQQQLLAKKIAEQRQREEKKQKRIQVVQSQRAEMAAEKERFRQRNLEKLQVEQDKATKAEYVSTGAARR